MASFLCLTEILFRYQVMDVPTGVLRGVSDRFNGITVDSTNTNVTLGDDQQFDEMLTSE